MIELHRVENRVADRVVEPAGGQRPAEHTARLLIADGLRHLEQAADELFRVGATRRCLITDALAAFRAADDVLPATTPCAPIQALLEEVLRTASSRRLRATRRRITRTRARAKGLLGDPLALRSCRRPHGA